MRQERQEREQERAPADAPPARANVTAIAMAIVAIGPPSRCTMFTAVVATLSFSFGTDAYAADTVGNADGALPRGAQEEAELDAGRRDPSLRHPDERRACRGP